MALTIQQQAPTARPEPGYHVDVDGNGLPWFPGAKIRDYLTPDELGLTQAELEPAA